MAKPRNLASGLVKIAFAASVDLYNTQDSCHSLLQCVNNLCQESIPFSTELGLLADKALPITLQPSFSLRLSFFCDGAESHVKISSKKYRNAYQGQVGVNWGKVWCKRLGLIPDKILLITRITYLFSL